MATRFAIASVLVVACSSLLQAADNEKEIQQAIKAGQEFLRKFEERGGGPIGPAAAIVGIGGNGRGSSCLAGMALIESGLPSSDAVVAALANDARQNALTPPRPMKFR